LGINKIKTSADSNPKTGLSQTRVKRNEKDIKLIQSFKKPDPVIVETLKALYLFLGKKWKNWEEGKNNLTSVLNETDLFDRSKVSEDVMDKVVQMQLDVAEIEKCSALFANVARWILQEEQCSQITEQKEIDDNRKTNEEMIVSPEVKVPAAPANTTVKRNPLVKTNEEMISEQLANYRVFM
jgi:hypothetical protein